ncbi:tripartite tricarboxylate transporter substrate binding protein [Aquincola tertiaricarbonis]|uniref:Tripartite tricarboxylate transporter substrate binding protein n=1 Tax=Aquincola tertiaricarbonis TaxID=391953 RepID=A0ABY4RYR1_AQUTE|nr:tripartite tricarboxylate transporter substrate binding protein [Aquincola tertiaricarbonis]URI05933.1 tripartite tricarboxylate transporter substrate binding protein [Aquincola tertiaricarbonis]
MCRDLPALPRRQLLLAGLATALPAWAQSAAWPHKSLRLVVAFPPGGLADVMCRVVQPTLAAALGQTLVVDNRAGAAGNLAASEVVANGKDGHSLLVTTSTTESVNPAMFARMPVDFDKDLQPVGQLANSLLFLIARPGLPVNTLKDLVAHAKAHPDTLSYGSAGVGTTPHLAGELFKQAAGITAAHVPYRGAAPAIQDVMAGQVDFAFAPGTVLPSMKAGKLKVLAVASRQRSSSAPTIPTFEELGYADVVADTRFGVYAPAGLPAAAVELFNRELNKALALPETQRRFTELGADAVPLTPAAYRGVVQAETRLFRGIVKARGITAE